MSFPLREVRGWEYVEPFCGPDKWIATLSCDHRVIAEGDAEIREVRERAAKSGHLPCEDCEKAYADYDRSKADPYDHAHGVDR